MLVSCFFYVFSEIFSSCTLKSLHSLFFFDIMNLGVDSNGYFRFTMFNTIHGMSFIIIINRRK